MKRNQSRFAIQCQMQCRDIRIADKNLWIRAHQAVVDVWQKQVAAGAAGRRPHRIHVAIQKHGVEVFQALGDAASIFAIGRTNIFSGFHFQAEGLEVLHAPLDEGIVKHATGRDQAYQISVTQHPGFDERPRRSFDPRARHLGSWTRERLHRPCIRLGTMWRGDQ